MAFILYNTTQKNEKLLNKHSFILMIILLSLFFDRLEGVPKQSEVC